MARGGSGVNVEYIGYSLAWGESGVNIEYVAHSLARGKSGVNVEYVEHSLAQESAAGHLPGLYYLISWKGYPEEENTWEPASAVQHLALTIKFLQSKQRK